MTRKTTDSLRLIAPPGPLVWLHPDLARAGAALQDQETDTGKRSPLLDLQTEGLSGQDLLELIGSRAPREIEVEDGPLGYTLWLWLSQVFRRQGPGLPRPVPSPFTDRIEDGQENNRPLPLESLLKRVSRYAEENAAETVVLDAGHDESRFEAMPLSADTARSLLSRESQSARLLWLLPLRSGDALENDLARYAKTVQAELDLFRNSGPIPFFDTEPASLDRKVTGRAGEGGSTRLPLSWWGLLPGDEWPRAIRKRFLELFRLLHPDRIFYFRTLENYALAGIDSYLEALMNRFVAPVKPARDLETKPLILGICGTDGSGKSSHVASLKDYLQSKGLKVCVHKIYRHGVFHDTVTDLTRQCARDKNLHLWRLQRIVKAMDSIKYYYNGLEEVLREHDVVIFDRYVYTHLAAGVGRYHHDPFARELLEPFPRADRIYLLDVPTDEAMRRIGTRDERTVDENTYMLARYRHALKDLADRYGFVVLDAVDPFEKNREAIIDDVEKLLKTRKPGGGS